MAKIDQKIQKVAIADLIPYERNAKLHPAEQVQKIADSISEFGFLNPVLIDTKKRIIAGHGRVEAAKLLGIKEVPCLCIEDLTEAQRRAYILADNRLTELGGWDDVIVSQELEELREAGFDINLTGFDIDDIVITDDMDADISEEEVKTIASGTPRVKSGEIWMLGGHRLMCGDSTNPDDVKKLMGGGMADLLLTDPPYNVAIVGGSHGESIEERLKKGALTIQNDAMTTSEFFKFLVSAFSNAYDVLKKGASFYVWYASCEVVNFQTALEKSNLPVKQELVWNKSSLVMGRQDYQWKHEPCLYGWKEGAAHYFIDMRTLTTVQGQEIEKLDAQQIKELYTKIIELTTIQNEARPIKSELHPTMKPVPLFKKLIRNSSREGESVLDLFGGSGTTLIACEDMDRKCYMMEYDPHYAEVIIQRWETYTGEKAYKLK